MVKVKKGMRATKKIYTYMYGAQRRPALGLILCKYIYMSSGCVKVTFK